MPKVQPLKLDLDDIYLKRKVSASITNKEFVMMKYLMEYYEINRTELFGQMIKAVFYQTRREEKYMT